MRPLTPAWDLCPVSPPPGVGGMGGRVDRGKSAELYRTWGPAIYRRCLRLLRDTEAARDATQEVFRKALSSPESSSPSIRRCRSSIGSPPTTA